MLHVSLSAKTIESLALALKGIHDVHGSDCLATGVLGVGHRITDDVLKEDLEHTAGFLVDETRNTLDTTTTGETANGWLGDALDVIAKDLSVALGTALSKTFASFSTAGHDF